MVPVLMTEQEHWALTALLRSAVTIRTFCSLGLGSLLERLNSPYIEKALAEGFDALAARDRLPYLPMSVVTVADVADSLNLSARQVRWAKDYPAEAVSAAIEALRHQIKDLTTIRLNERISVLLRPAREGDCRITLVPDGDRGLTTVNYTSEGVIVDVIDEAGNEAATLSIPNGDLTLEEEEGPAWACPQCGSKNLSVMVTVSANLTQSGDNFETDPNGDHEWDGDSLMTCRECQYTAASRQFES